MPAHGHFLLNQSFYAHSNRSHLALVLLKKVKDRKHSMLASLQQVTHTAVQGLFFGRTNGSSDMTQQDHTDRNGSYPGFRSPISQIETNISCNSHN